MTKKSTRAAKASGNPAITIVGDERKLRSLVRRAIRAGLAASRSEEQVIEDEFIRLATATPKVTKRPAVTENGQEVPHA